ncbi:biopolymer transport protein ExbD [Ereboglobus sp. PH5-5]|uniref:ExbD/TolR family protein n=1 Tax=Ereboglobus sp. PH5-5 TaxID=2940529 RepID=UPI0024053F39|nr:biopolymer transporter ExbD [Ereboglobus sp. PH5-5]MDF9832388.1 biopolymer transport protein ExbD [Ereboglobus sp. PH5-5]
MIIRPLDLNSKLSPPPRSYDWVHFVNLTLIAMFFLFFGSRFILSPAIVVKSSDFQLPSRPADRVSYVPGTTVVSIKGNGQIFADTGIVSHAQLEAWLAEKIKNSPDASLLVRADAAVTIEEVSRIADLAGEIGFKVSILANPEKKSSPSFRPSGPQAGQ